MVKTSRLPALTIRVKTILLPSAEKEGP